MRNPVFAFLLLIVILISSCAPQSHLLRGKYYLDKKKYDRAVRELEKASKENGDTFYYIDVYSRLGDAYAGGGHKENAMAVYRNALQIIHLRLREVSARRREIRMSLNAQATERRQTLQDEDLRLSNEEWRLKEAEEDITIKFQALMNVSK